MPKNTKTTRNVTVLSQDIQPGKSWYENQKTYLSSKIGEVEYHPSDHDIKSIPDLAESLRYYKPGFKKHGINVSELSNRIKSLKMKHQGKISKSDMKNAIPRDLRD